MTIRITPCDGEGNPTGPAVEVDGTLEWKPEPIPGYIHGRLADGGEMWFRADLFHKVADHLDGTTEYTTDPAAYRATAHPPLIGGIPVVPVADN